MHRVWDGLLYKSPKEVPPVCYDDSKCVMVTTGGMDQNIRARGPESPDMSLVLSNRLKKTNTELIN